MESNTMYRYTNKTVLIVEDDTYNFEYLEEILSETGLNLMHIKSGKNAIDLVSFQDFDLILMDIRLPDIDGYEVTRKIIQSNPNAKIIAQTAFALIDDRQKALNAGCIDFISKPIKKNDLLILISKYLK